MKKLLLTVIGVTIVFVGFITILCLLPCNGGCCRHHHDSCEMKDSDGKCSGDKDECRERRTEKCWVDADGKMHKEVRVMIGDGNEMGNCPMENGKCEMGNAKCPMDSMMNGKCSMEKMGDGKCSMGNMQMCCGANSGCCCCCMMMNGNHCSIETDEKGEKWEKKNDSVKIKVRSKL